MTEEAVRQAALEIAADMIAAARESGELPVAWVTGNSYMPPLRSYTAAEEIWQADDTATLGFWNFLVEELESLLAEHNVYSGCPDYDNSIYVVDMDRFTFDPENSPFDPDTLHGEYTPVADQDDVCAVCGDALWLNGSSPETQLWMHRDYPGRSEPRDHSAVHMTGVPNPGQLD